MQRKKILIFFLSVQDPSDIKTKFSELLSKVSILPEQENSPRRRKKRTILVSRRLSRFPALVHRIVISNGKRQFPNLDALDFKSKWGKAVADLAGVEHVISLLLLFSFRSLQAYHVGLPCQAILAHLVLLTGILL